MKTFDTTIEAILAKKKRKRAAAAIIVPLLITSLAFTTILSAQAGTTAEVNPQAAEAPLEDSPGIAAAGTAGAEGAEGAPASPLTAYAEVPPGEPDPGPGGADGAAGAEGEGGEDSSEVPKDSILPADGLGEYDGPDGAAAVMEYNGPEGDPVVAFNENDGLRPGVAICGRKTVNGMGTAAPARSFTFTLTQVRDGQGAALTGAAAISPNPLTKQVNTAGAGNYDFSFDIPRLASGVYYFKLAEQPGAANDGWNHDAIEYVIRVTVDGSGRTSMDCRSRTGPSAAWGEWAEYVSGTSAGAPSQANVNIPAYTFNASHNFTFVDDYYPGNNIGLGIRMANPRMRDTTSNTMYYPMCADGLKQLPANGQRMQYGVTRDDTESALFFALRAEPNSLGLPGLSTADWNRFFGINVTHPDGRVGYMRCMLWAYEEYYNNGQQLDLDDPASWSTGSRPLRLVEYMLTILDLRDTQANRNAIAETFKAINKNVKGIMQQYRAGKATSLAMSYKATGANTGTLSFAHDGYVPTNASGAEQYNTTLSWAPASNVTVRVTRNGNTSTLSQGASVYKTDAISVTNNSGGEVTFTLSDSAKYLKPGSIKGDLLVVAAAPWDRQPVLLGTAGFVTLACAATTCGEPKYLPFINMYTSGGNPEDPRADVTIRARKAVAGANAPPRAFSFTLTQVGDDQGGALAGPPAISPNPLTKQASMAGTGDSKSFSFDITGLKSGVYYFKLAEQPGAADDEWEFDGTEYLVRVTVDGYGKPSMDYRSRTGPSAPWGAWAAYSSGIAYGASSQANVDIPPYAFDASHSFAFVDDYFPGSNIGLGRQLANPRMRDTTANAMCYPMCADGMKTIPVSGQKMVYGFSRDNTESALFFSLRAEPNSLGLPGLSTADWNRFFGIDVTHPDGRVGYMRCMLWAYEEYYNNGQQLDLDNPASWSTGSRPLKLVEYMLTVLDLRDTQANRNAIAETFKAINKNTKGIMQQYRAGKATSLNMAYTATGANTGTLSFGHDGYVPTNASGAEQYNTALSWTPTGNVTVRVTRNGNTSTLSRGAAVYKTDVISVTNNSGGAVAFTLADSAKYLKPGSIKGDLLEVGAAPWDRQPLLLGTAGFVTLACTVATCGEPYYLPYTNTFTERDETGPVLPEVGGNAAMPFAVSALLATALLSALLAGAFIYRFFKRRKCVAGL